MDVILQIAGTFGVPTALLAAVLWWVLIPLAKAHVENLNKVGDAIAAVPGMLSTISTNQAEAKAAALEARAAALEARKAVADNKDAISKACRYPVTPCDILPYGQRP